MGDRLLTVGGERGGRDGESVTEAEIIAGAIVTGSGGLGAAIWGVARFAVGRIVKALDDNTTAQLKLATESALQAETNRVLADKIDRVSEWVDEHTPVNNPQIMPPAEQAYVPSPAGVLRSGKTPPSGVPVSGRYHQSRPGTKGDR